MTWGQGTSSSSPPLPSASSTQPASPAFHVALARKACNRLAPSLALIGLEVGPGTGHPPPVLRAGVLLLTPLEWGGDLSGSPAWWITACAAPDLADSSLGCSANVLLPSHSPTKSTPSDDLSTNRPQQAAVCSTEQTNKNRSSLTTREGFQQTTLLPEFPLPSSSSLLASRMTVPPCDHTETQHGSTPRNCDFADEPFPRAGPKTRTLERSRSSTLPALWGWRVPPP